MSNDLVSKLRPWVTTFSGAIKFQHAHKDELKVGGKIVHIFDLAGITKDEKDMTYLTIDDDVGLISLLLPGDIYKDLNTLHSFTEGMLVIATGRLLDPDGTLKKEVEQLSKDKTKSSYRSIKEAYRIDEPAPSEPLATIVCWSLEPLKEEAPKVE